MNRKNHLEINYVRIIAFLYLISIILVTLSLLAELPYCLVLEDNFLIEASETFGRLFSLDRDGNIPTYYSSLLLTSASLLLILIAFAKKIVPEKYFYYWIALSVTFLYMALDEACQIHEVWRGVLTYSNIIIDKSYHKFAWIPAGIAYVLIFTLFFFRFLWSLPVKFKYLFILSGTIYIGGALVMEQIGAIFYFMNSTTKNFPYILSYTIEESLEMLGIIIFIHSLVIYIRTEIGEVSFNFINKNDNMSQSKTH